MTRLGKALQDALTAHLQGGPARPPEAGFPLWLAFLSLSRTRRHHWGGPEPISFAEIEAYCRLMRTPFDPHHVEILMAMDHTWMTWANDRPPEGVKTLPQRSAQGLSAALFDAMTG